MEANLQETLARLRPLLRQDEDPRPVVLMTCGIAGKRLNLSLGTLPLSPSHSSHTGNAFERKGNLLGSGKTTLVRAVISEFSSFHRISIDAIIAERHGIYGVDYPADNELYGTYQDEADRIYLLTFQQLLHNKQNIALERSFYAKEDRDEFRQMIEEGGGRCVLVYLKADKDLLWRRIQERKAKGKTADSALEITHEILDRYVSGWEAPVGEGEIVIDVE